MFLNLVLNFIIFQLTIVEHSSNRFENFLVNYSWSSKISWKNLVKYSCYIGSCPRPADFLHPFIISPFISVLIIPGASWTHDAMVATKLHPLSYNDVVTPLIPTGTFINTWAMLTPTSMQAAGEWMDWGGTCRGINHSSSPTCRRIISMIQTYLPAQQICEETVEAVLENGRSKVDGWMHDDDEWVGTSFGRYGALLAGYTSHDLLELARWS